MKIEWDCLEILWDFSGGLTKILRIVSHVKFHGNLESKAERSFDTGHVDSSWQQARETIMFTKVQSDSMDLREYNLGDKVKNLGKHSDP